MGSAFSRPPRTVRRSPARRAGWVLVTVLAVAVGASGCTTWRGARLYHSGTAALEQGDVSRALEDLEAAARLVPERSEVHNNLGLAQLSADREDLALHSFERATRLDCRNEQASDNLRMLEARLETEQ